MLPPWRLHFGIRVRAVHWRVRKHSSCRPSDSQVNLGARGLGSGRETWERGDNLDEAETTKRGRSMEIKRSVPRTFASASKLRDRKTADDDINARVGSQSSNEGPVDYLPAGPHRSAFRGPAPDAFAARALHSSREPRTGGHPSVGQTLIVKPVAAARAARADDCGISSWRCSLVSAGRAAIGTAQRPTTAIDHIAIQEALGRKAVDWMRR